MEWEGSGRISISHADRLARCTNTPLGYLYLNEFPDGDLPIPDFPACEMRPRWPSPDLLETVHLMVRRQAWMREKLLDDGADPLPFVCCCGLGLPATDAASAMREHLELEAGWAARQRSWMDTLRYLRERVEERGVLVVFNSVVGNNTHRKPDRNEMQGFALIDRYAPLVFVNEADFRAVRMFTLAHELAHMFAGVAAVSHLDTAHSPGQGPERFCNSVAAEFLVPEEEPKAHWRWGGAVADSLQAVARQFKVSVLVAAWRTLHPDLIDRDGFRRFHDAYQQHMARRPDETSGGNFWNSRNVRHRPPIRGSGSTRCAGRSAVLS